MNNYDKILDYAKKNEYWRRSRSINGGVIIVELR